MKRTLNLVIMDPKVSSGVEEVPGSGVIPRKWSVLRLCPSDYNKISWWPQGLRIVFASDLREDNRSDKQIVMKTTFNIYWEQNFIL